MSDERRPFDAEALLWKLSFVATVINGRWWIHRSSVLKAMNEAYRLGQSQALEAATRDPFTLPRVPSYLASETGQ